ncbi:MAG: hypothetical protein JSU67_03705, partial [Gammaproteobacteria bacterium]
QTTFYHHDALGSIIATSNENGFLQLTEEYQPYGEKIYQTEDLSSGNEDWYTGKNYNKELDLTYFGARWYDAKQGRFLSMDPVGVQFPNIHTFNRYHYANDNPYKYVDPDGMAPDPVVEPFGGFGRSGSFSDDFRGYQIGHSIKLVTESGTGGGAPRIGNSQGLKVSSDTKIGRVFWSGPGSRDAAEAFAKTNRAKTLEMTLTGKVLDKITTPGNFKYMKPFWNAASKRFAQGARGQVDVFHSGKGVRVDSLWAKKEYPILKEQGNDINYHVIEQ